MSDELDGLVRDACSIVPVAKSEYRQRLLAWADRQRAAELNYAFACCSCPKGKCWFCDEHRPRRLKQLGGADSQEGEETMFKTIKNWLLMRLHSRSRHYDLFGKRIDGTAKYIQVCFVCNKRFGDDSQEQEGSQKPRSGG